MTRAENGAPQFESLTEAKVHLSDAEIVSILNQNLRAKHASKALAQAKQMAYKAWKAAQVKKAS